MGDVLEGSRAVSPLPAQLGQVEMATCSLRAPSVLMGERKRLVEMLFRGGELRRVRPDGGQTEDVVGDELPAPFAAFAGPIEDLFGEASGFLVVTGIGVGLGEPRPREHPEKRSRIDVHERLQGALEERQGLAGASRPRRPSARWSLATP
jgi:hypothetical protein